MKCLLLETLYSIASFLYIMIRVFLSLVLYLQQRRTNSIDSIICEDRIHLLELGGYLFSFIQLIELSFFPQHLIKNQLVVVLHEENRI